MFVKCTVPSASVNEKMSACALAGIAERARTSAARRRRWGTNANGAFSTGFPQVRSFLPPWNAPRFALARSFESASHARPLPPAHLRDGSLSRRPSLARAPFRVREDAASLARGPSGGPCPHRLGTRRKGPGARHLRRRRPRRPQNRRGRERQGALPSGPSVGRVLGGGRRTGGGRPVQAAANPRG